MTVYVASRARNPAHRRAWLRLREEGWPIHASWLDAGDDIDPSTLWTTAIAEVMGSRGVVVAVAPDDLPLRGVLVEVGAALAAGVPVVLVAPAFGEVREALGSWVHHPLVSRADSVEEAVRRILGR